MARMSRREMRKAGLLKPKPGDEDQDAVPADEPEPSEAPDHGTSGPVPTPMDDPERADEHSEEPHTGLSEDGETDLGETAMIEPQATSHDAEEEQSEPSPQSQASPERTSVFDRFSTSDRTDDSRTVPRVEDESTEPADVVAPLPPLETDDSDEDYAGALRARLKSEPPALDDSTDEEDDEPEPSRWKTILLFLILIVVGFGVGIFLGSLIFAGGEAGSAPYTTEYFYPGAL
ncbi:hypothetical protein [Flaviflexus huanghaiensis]|uniref:hypothetical protein n=1 Tax=Flaviflexus huanghaiensis TaxID=1111473 RepID=UPI0015F8A7D3|nr:hypothetical protein [Flaviflexus huanghaiensis]